MIPKTVSIQLNSYEIGTIADFFEVLHNIDHFSGDKMIIDIFDYLLNNWHRISNGDPIIYVDKIGEKSDTE